MKKYSCPLCYREYGAVGYCRACEVSVVVAEREPEPPRRLSRLLHAIRRRRFLSRIFRSNACPECAGLGQTRLDPEVPFACVRCLGADCPTCGGSGEIWIEWRRCAACGGTGER